MNFSYIIFAMFLSLQYADSAPAEKSMSMYDAITEKCPYVKSIPNYKGSLFNTCNNWKTISEVRALTGDNREDVQCLLYYVSLTTYCNNTQTPEVLIPRTTLERYDLNTICSYMKTIPDQTLGAIFANKTNCLALCDEMTFVKPICGLSYHFMQAVASPVVKEKSRQEPVSPAQAQQTADSSKLKSNPADDAALQENIKNGDNTQHGVEAGVKNVEILAAPQNSGINQDLQNNHPADPDVADPPQQEAAQVQEQTVSEGKVPETETTVAEQQAVNNNLQEQNIKQGIEIPNTNNDDHSVDVKPQQPNDNIHDSSNAAVKPVQVQSVEKGADNAKPQDQEVAQKSDMPNQQDLLFDQDPQIPDNEIEDVPGSQEDNGESAVAPREDKSSKPKIDDGEPANYNTEMEGDSFFFTYFMILCIIFIAGYVCYHNKQKILALILEGRRGKRQYRGRRPNSANYHKLDSNLEEAINSSCKKNTTNVIY